MTSPLEQSLRRLWRSRPARREPAWLERLRAESFAEFTAHGLPTTNLEDWRFTSLAKLEKLEVAAGQRAVAPKLEEPAGQRAVFCNGRFEPSLSRLDRLPRGCRVESLASVLADTPERARAAFAEVKGRPFATLNTALFEDGACIEIDPGVQLEQPIELSFAYNGDLPAHASVRNLILVGAGARAVVEETHVGAPGLATTVTAIATEANASLEHVLQQRLDERSFGFFHLLATQERDSHLGLHSIALGAALARVEIESRLAAEGASVTANGLYLGRGTQHQDHHVAIDHAAPHTQSRQLFKGILEDRAHGVFHGRVHVRPHAQKIDAVQTNRALLLSDRAVIDSKPQLEIYADDVKCSHGASIGQLDEAQLFYLRSRGLDLPAARALLTQAFASEVLAQLPVESLRSSLEAALLEWLPRGAR
jgi:Fe-S cluster assembly protein SufD